MLVDLGGTPPRGFGMRLQSLVLSVLLQMGLPLLPLVVEFLRNGLVTERSVAVTSGMWVIGVALSSDVPFILWGGTVAGVTLAVALGVTEGQTVPSHFPKMPLYTMGVMGIVFLAERLYKHVWVGAPCVPVEKD
jgi:hypothetical protein